MELELAGRVAVVTGGAAGIGEAIARTLAAEGCKVWIVDRDEANAREKATALCRADLTVYSAAIDVGDAAAVSTAFGEIVEMHGRVDILVNAAGLLSTGTIANSPAAEWERISRVNLSGVVHCSKAAIPIMTAQRHGRIVNIASISAMRGGGSIGNTLYGASKAGVVALTMGLARELGPYAITANAVAPAVVDTAMTHAALTEDARQRILARIPLGRLATLSDIADLAAFLASARAGFITGTVIPVDGGILTT
jgi:NAD(P)-dependent dehydrogenase (short-subunit alcohol dehydrogenase family)